MIFLTTFFTISSEDITTMTGYLSDFISNITPLLLPIIAVMVGIFIFWAIVKAIRP